MKTHHKIIIEVMVMYLTTNISFGQQMNRIDMTDWRNGREERKICRDLCSKMISWLSDANEVAGIECEELVDSLIQLKEPSVKSYFVAAQVMNLRGKTERAIIILEKLVLEHNDESAEIMQFPVGIVGRFWIAAMARQLGDEAKAIDEYENILQNLDDTEGHQSLLLICNLYLAEIESKDLNAKDQTLSRLRKSSQTTKPSGHWETQYDIYKAWTAYQLAALSSVNSNKSRDSVEESEMIYAFIFAVTHLKLSGMASQPLTDYQSDTKKAEVMSRTILDRILQNPISHIDTSLARLVYGYSQKEKREYEQAEKYFKALFNSDSFFSPVGGICLANCMKSQDNTKEAYEVLQQVVARHPGSKPLTEKLKESWKQPN